MINLFVVLQKVSLIINPSMNIVLFQAILLFTCLIGTYGNFSKKPSGIKTGTLELLTKINTQNTKDRYPIPGRLQQGDQVALNVASLKLENSFENWIGQEISWSVDYLLSSGEVELKIHACRMGVKWQLQVRYLFIKEEYIKSGVFMTSLTIPTTSPTIMLQNSMEIFIYQSNQMNQQFKDMRTGKKQILLFLNGFTTNLKQYNSTSIVRFNGFFTDETQISLISDLNQISTCILTLIIVERQKFANMGLTFEISYQYFPNFQSEAQNQYQIGQFQLGLSCSKKTQKSCWAMRSLNFIEIRQLDKRSSSGVIMEPKTQISKRQLPNCNWGAVACPCTNPLATVCYKDWNCNVCWVAGCKDGYYQPWFVNDCRTCPTIANCIACRLTSILSSTPSCSKCASGFTLIGKSCTICSTGCTSCTSVTVSGVAKLSCTGCSSNLSLQLVNSVNICACLSTQYTVSGSCYDCPSICTVCSSSTVCTKCVSDRYLYNSNCLACMPVCKTCLTGSTCGSCPSNLFTLTSVCTCNSPNFFDSVSKTCQPCSYFQNNCTKCVYATAYSPSAPPPVICLTPASGFYVMTNGSTAACIAYCTNCTSNPILCDIPLAGFIFDSANCVCANGTYFQNGKCKACTTIVPGCSTCTTNPIPTATTCSACNPIGFFNDTAYPVTSCPACASLCRICNSLTDCTTCLNNLYPVGGICYCDDITHNTSLYFNPTTKYCVNCNLVISNCATCASNGSTTVTCSACGLGMYLSSTGLQCVPCPSSCTACLNISYCTSCQPGYDSFNNTCICGLNCINCIANSTDHLCSSCNFNNSNFSCTGCIAGYLIDMNGLCSPCNLTIPGCDECTSLGCTACYPPFVLVLGECVCNNTAGLYLTLNSSTCLPCNQTIPYCSSCSNAGPLTICISVLTGYFINVGGQSCSLCAGFCLACSGTNTSCDSCQPTFSIMAANSCECNTTNGDFYSSLTKGCSACATIIPNCLTCSAAGLNTTCCQCIDKYFWDGIACVQCPSTCSNCSSALVCLSCPSKFVLSESLAGWIVAGQCVCDPNSNASYYDSLTKTCQPCSYFSPSCAACNLATTEPVCNTCIDGTYLVNGTCAICSTSCSSCSSYSVCTSCPGNLTLSGGSCICNSACSQCKTLSDGCLSCAISQAGAITDCFACQPGMYLSSPNCVVCPSSCTTCTDPNTCTTCQTSYIMNNGVCQCATSLGVFPTLAAKCVLCGDIFYGCVQCSLASGSTACADCAQGYFLNGTQCQACIQSCLSCDGSASTCTTCTPGLTLVNNTCTCSDALCLACSTSSPNCAQCVYTIQGNFSTCGVCQPGYYLNNGACTACSSTCVTCGTGGFCLTCPNTFQVINGSCGCDNAAAFWKSANVCKTCTELYPNCQTCVQDTSIPLNVSCIACLYEYYFVNTSCVASVCGDGAITSGQNCDDGNKVSSDGCSDSCQVEVNFECLGLPSICTMNLNYHIYFNSLTTSTSSCNQLSINFNMDPIYSVYDTVDFRPMLSLVSQPELQYKSWSYKEGVVTYTFAYTATLNNQTVTFYFAPQNLNINQTSTVPLITVPVLLLSSNNLLIVYYPPSDCESKKNMRGLTKAVQYASYGTLALSALPSKVIGLQLFGVLQLAYISIGSMDNVNTMLTPLMEMKEVQGFSMPMGKEKRKRLLQGGLTPDRVQSIGYQANFLRNCNIMLLIVVVVIAVAFALYALTYCCRQCAPSLHKFSQRLFKEVLLTLILFNCFNFAYSAGLHFSYAPKDDYLYNIGTVAAVLALVLPLVMAILLMCLEDTGFGQFKEKLKSGPIERLYFVFTIIYRSGIGLYMSTMNEDSLSTLIVMAFVITFLLYNLVNLPYTHAYHNYRANVCHFAQAICLFVAMYYRSMTSSQSPIQVAPMYTPAYLEFTAILISLIVSLIVLVYEIYLFIRECLTSSDKQPPSSIIRTTQNNDNSKSNLQQKGKPNIFSIDFVDAE